jgi:mannan endo-1,4-beta-mannosidase
MRAFKTYAIVILLIASAIGNAQAAPAAPNAAPVNPDATVEARALLREIDSISGHATLTGQHNFPNHVSRWSDRIYDLTGKFPAVFGQDFGFSGGEDKDSVEGRPAMIEEVKRQYRNGAVIALTWHAVRPTDDEPVTFRDSVQGHLTDFEWNELLTPGTEIYSRWVEQTDVIAGYLRQLQAAGVPVLFRPYHEMNGNWFWWGGRPGEKGSAALYRQIFDRFVNVYHLNNLVWVWNVNSPSENAGSIPSYYPGPKYVDIVTMDIYGEFKQSFYDDTIALAGDKPVALAEVGAMPALDVLAQQPRWAYFMMWSGVGEGANSPEKLQAVFHAHNLLNRGDPPFTAPGTPKTSRVDPVSSNASSQAKALLERLYAESGIHTLSGQHNEPGSLEGATQQVLAATGKRPAIYGAELDAGAGGSALNAAIEQSRDQSIVSLKWLPANPADIEQAGHDSRHRLLTDYEWRELVSPGTNLNQRWCAQVDAAAESLRKLDDKGVAVLWTPYPESNGKQYWWAGRSGTHGSAALYRMLFDRLVNHDQMRNLLWVWEAAAPGFGPGANGSLGEYFPGLLYADALALDVNRTESRFRSDTFLRSFAVDKIIGLSIDGAVPPPAFFQNQTNWAWFMAAPQAVQSGNGSDSARNASTKALRDLYADPRIVSR